MIEYTPAGHWCTTTMLGALRWDGFPREQHGRRWRASADTSLNTAPTPGELTVNAKDHGGEVVFTGHADDDYIVQVDIDRNSGYDGALYFRYLDPDNWYRARLVESTPQIPPRVGVKLEKMLHGQLSTVDSATPLAGTWRTVKVRCAGSSIKVWVQSTLEIDATDSDIPWGAVGLSGWQAKFRNLKAGYDNNADYDIDDGEDYVVLDEAFGGTSVSPTYDHNGNLTADADYAYTYDAPALDSPPSAKPTWSLHDHLLTPTCHQCGVSRVRTTWSRWRPRTRPTSW